MGVVTISTTTTTMTNATTPDVPTAHIDATLTTVYPDVDGEVDRDATAHVTAELSTTEPGD